MKYRISDKFLVLGFGRLAERGYLIRIYSFIGYLLRLIIDRINVKIS